MAILQRQKSGGRWMQRRKFKRERDQLHLSVSGCFPGNVRLRAEQQPHEYAPLKIVPAESIRSWVHAGKIASRRDGGQIFISLRS
jgi:hypothetical protein